MKAFVFPAFDPDYSTGLAVVIATCEMEAKLFLIAAMVRCDVIYPNTDFGVCVEVGLYNGFAVFVSGGS